MAYRALLALLAIVLVLVACDAAGDDTTTTEAALVTTTTTPGTTATSPSEPAATTTTQPDLSGVDLPPAVAAQLEDLIAATEGVRSLPFLEAPNVAVVSPDELTLRIREEIEAESEGIPADEALYKLLGLLEPEADFESLLLDLYGEQVAGFYDGDTREIVIRAREDELSVLEQSTLVHELVHALTDQHFEFNNAYEEMLDDERLDQASAYQALIEGDATLAQVSWVQSLSQEEIGEFVAESLGTDTSALDAAPDFLAEALIFPYDTGLAFTQSLFASGGWEAVNEAYDLMLELPGSSEQVITPDDYRRDLPIPVEIPQISIPGYELERTSVWGELGFRIMLDQELASVEALNASDGWGGDSYHQWFDGENAALLVVYEGDTARDVEELRQSLLSFARNSVAEEDFVWVDEEEGLLYFIAADELEVGERIRASVGLG